MIRLTRASLPEALWESAEQRHVWPLRVTASPIAPEVDPNIFVYHAHVDQDPYTGDTFECVASVQQLSEIPVGSPAVLEGRLIPYYRKALCEFVCRSAAEHDEVWDTIVSATRDLVQNLKASNTMLTEETLDLE